MLARFARAFAVCHTIGEVTREANWELVTQVPVCLREAKAAAADAATNASIPPPACRRIVQAISQVRNEGG
jgi:hypothetical protein